MTNDDDDRWSLSHKYCLTLHWRGGAKPKSGVPYAQSYLQICVSGLVETNNKLNDSHISSMQLHLRRGPCYYMPAACLHDGSYVDSDCWCSHDWRTHALLNIHPGHVDAPCSCRPIGLVNFEPSGAVHAEWRLFGTVRYDTAHGALKLCNNKLCGMPPQYATAPCKLTFDHLTLKVVSESRVTWATFVQILVFLARPLCSRLRPDVRDRHTDRHQTRIIA